MNIHPPIIALGTALRLIRFSNDFGVTVIRHQNADVMVLASELMRSIPL